MRCHDAVLGFCKLRNLVESFDKLNFVNTVAFQSLVQLSVPVLVPLQIGYIHTHTHIYVKINCYWLTGYPIQVNVSFQHNFNILFCL